MHTVSAPPSRRFGGLAAARCGAAAVGACAGGLVAFPVGGFLAAYLFTNVGKSIVTGVVSRGMEGQHGLQAVFVAILLFVAGIVMAAIVVFALVAPVFVLLPMATTGIALRLARAGLVMRSLWLTLAAAALFSIAVLMVLSAAKADARWWMWLAIVVVSAFVGRAVVELSWPVPSGVPARAMAVGRRWKTFGVVWLLVVAAVLAALAVVFVATQVHVH